MQLKNFILLTSLLFIRSPHHLQTTQSNSKQLAIPTLAFTFLSNRLSLSNTKQNMGLLNTISKINTRSNKLTHDEQKILSQHIHEETIQLGKELPSIKDNEKLASMQSTYQQLKNLQQQLQTASLTQTIHRPHELPIPANGKCLYTTIILGYLLPVANNPNSFNQRLKHMVGTEKLPITHEQLASQYQDLHYLHSNPGFQQAINQLLKKTGIKQGIWGGPQEVQLIADKLNFNIQEHTPDPDNPKQLIKSDLTTPKKWVNPPETTLHIVQDVPRKKELICSDDDPNLQQGQVSSLQTSTHRHHYRLYYSGKLPQPPQEERKNQDNASARLIGLLHPLKPGKEFDWIKRSLAVNIKDINIEALKRLPKLLQALQPQEKLGLVEPFKKVLADKDKYMQRHVLEVLPLFLKILPPDDRESALQLFNKALANRNNFIQKVAMRQLAEVVQALPPQDAFQWINKALNHKEWRVRYTAINALLKISKVLHPQHKLNLLKKALTDHNKKVREASVGAMSQFLQTVTLPQQPPKVIHTKPPLPFSPKQQPSPKPKKQRLYDQLQSYYKTQSQLQSILSQNRLSLAKSYCNLTILPEEVYRLSSAKFLNKGPKPQDKVEEEDEENEEESKQDSDDEEGEDNADNEPEPDQRPLHERMDYTLLHKAEDRMKLEDVWKPYKNESKVPRHIIIIGEAGMGKSTFSQYIAYQWAKGNLWSGRFHWVLQLPLRRVRNLNDEKDPHKQIAVALAITNFYGSDLQKLLEKKQPGLLILDGYDEVAIEAEKEDSLLGKWLQSCFKHINLSIILTTRPGTHCPYLQKPRELRMLGFQQEEIEQYINIHLPPKKSQSNDSKPTTSQKATKLLEVMQQNPSLALLSHTPLYLQLLCILAKQRGPNTLGKCSGPELYQQIIAQVLGYHLAQHNNKRITKEEQALIFKTYGLEVDYLGELAFAGIRANQAVLPLDLQRKLLKQLRLSHPRTSPMEPDYWTRIASLGLLQGYTRSSPRPNQATYFPGLTIQEWLAARYLVTALYDKKHKDHNTAMVIMNQEKYAPRYQAILPFIAGLCYQHIQKEKDPKGKGLIVFWQLLEAQPRELSGIGHAMLVARCLEACKTDTSSQMPKKLQVYHKTLIQQVAAWLQALLHHPFDDKDVYPGGWHTSASVLLPRIADILPAGLQSCPLLLRHDLINQHVQPAWNALSLEGDKEDTTTKQWHTRVAKMKVLTRVPISHHTAKKLWTYLQQALQYKNEYLLTAAAEALPGVLEKLEPDDRKLFVKPFRNLFADKNEDVRKVAAKALPGVLEKLEPEDRKFFVKPFRNLFADKNEDVRKVVAKALPVVLEKLEPENRKFFVKPFQNLLDDKKEDVRYVAAETLPGVFEKLALQENLKWLQNALVDKNEDVRYAAAKALPGVLAKLEPDDRKFFVKPFQNLLDDDEYWVRAIATYVLPGVLAKLEPDDRKFFVNPFQNLVDDDEYWVRAIATYVLPGVLAKLEPDDSKSLVQSFQNALVDKNEDVRKVATYVLPGVLAKLEPDDRKLFVKPFQNFLADKNEDVQATATKALPGVLSKLESEDSKSLVQSFQNFLADKNEDVRVTATKALPGVLAKLEPDDRKIFVKPFRNFFADKDKDVRKAATKALPGVLAKLEPDDRKIFVKPFRNFFADKDKDVRKAAAKALPGVLQALQPKDRKACLTPFLNALKDKDKYVRRAALEALPGVLQELQPDDRKPCLKPFLNALKDKEYRVRRAAAGALPGVLQVLQPDDWKPFLKPFLNALKDKEYRVRRAAAGVLPGVLQVLQPDDWQPFLTFFLNALKDKEYRVRRAAAGVLPGVLQVLQPDDWKPFLTFFLNALKDDDYGVRKATLEALKDIEAQVWKPFLQDQLQANPQQEGLEDALKTWAYLLLRGSLLVCFSIPEQKKLPSYRLLIKNLQEQATRWGWPCLAYSAKPLPDNFNPSLSPLLYV